MNSPRAVTARILHRVLGGESLNKLLPHALDPAVPADRPLCQELIYGSLRHWPYLEALSQRFLRKPLRRKDQDVLALICVGLYELLHLHTPEHAVVSETVNACKALKKPWATGLVNGVLRSFQRQDGDLTPPLSAAAEHALPEWLYEALRREYGEHVEQIAASARHRPPMTLRVNQRRASRDQYLKTLAVRDIPAKPCTTSEDGVILERPLDVSQVPGFEQGEVSVQDSSAQLTARLMNPMPGERILDACAAPGGKACHLLEQQPDLTELVALDISENRLQRVSENSLRLGLTLKTAVADSTHLPDSILAPPFDAILADVPCSATGVMRRNPDIKILRQAEDIDRFATQQLAILCGLWPALKPGGRLLYVTCSLLHRENDNIVSTFCAEQGAVAEQISLPEGVAKHHGWQVLPHPNGGDGLYFAMLRKAST